MLHRVAFCPSLNNPLVDSIYRIILLIELQNGSILLADPLDEERLLFYAVFR